MLLFKRSTFIQQECITLIKSDEGIHNATKDFYFKQMLFFLYIYLSKGIVHTKILISP